MTEQSCAWSIQREVWLPGLVSMGHCVSFQLRGKAQRGCDKGTVFAQLSLGVSYKELIRGGLDMLQ